MKPEADGYFKIDNQGHFSKARKKDVTFSRVFERVPTYLALDNSLLDFFYLYFTKAFNFEQSLASCDMHRLLVVSTPR